ncbi:MAG: 6,7-dimethyl-8-ribityllumazine synthase [Candidatus Aldehydirespiratoraceae bacterium]|jgi:6,7-dimethyl-8-ribityllumazine synthase
MSDAARPRLAFVQSMWHDDIVDRAKDGFTEVAGSVADIEYFEVPGAFEIPLFVQSLAATGRFDGVIAAGFVVDGGVYRHEFVADAVISGLMRVQLDSSVPVFSCVLTPQQFHEHEDHIRFFTEHMIGKGRDVARSALATLAARADLS